MALKPQDAAITPPLKWAGGKRWLVPKLQQLFEPYADRRLNAPYGRRVARLSYERDFSKFAPLLCEYKFTCVDFESLRLEPSDFV